MRVSGAGIIIVIGLLLLYLVSKGYTKNFPAAWDTLMGKVKVG